MFLLCLGLWEVLLQVSGRSPLHMSVTVLFCLDSWEIRSLDPDAISEILPLTVERLIGVPFTRDPRGAGGIALLGLQGDIVENRRRLTGQLPQTVNEPEMPGDIPAVQPAMGRRDRMVEHLRLAGLRNASSRVDTFFLIAERTRPEILDFMSGPQQILSVAAALAEHVGALGDAGIPSVVARFELPLPIELGRELRRLPWAGNSRRVRAQHPQQAGNSSSEQVSRERSRSREEGRRVRPRR